MKGGAMSSIARLSLVCACVWGLISLIGVFGGDPAHAQCECSSLDASDGNPTQAVSVDHRGWVGVGTLTPLGKMDVVQGGLRARLCYGYEQFPGVDGHCGVVGMHEAGASGYLGVVEADPHEHGENHFGVKGVATGSALSNIGVYGVAYGGLHENLAGMFLGNVSVTSGNLAVVADTMNYTTLEMRNPFVRRAKARGRINFIDSYDEVQGAIEFHGPHLASGNGFRFKTGGNQTRLTIDNDGRAYVGPKGIEGFGNGERFVVYGGSGSVDDGFIAIQNSDWKDVGIRFYSGSALMHHVYMDVVKGFALRITPQNAFDTGGVTVAHNGNVGVNTYAPEEALHVEGTAKCTVLEITGGGDIAEPFDTAERKMIQAGMVVAIDPDHPGKLKISQEAYDRCVAGVVSGAGGLDPGVILSQAGSVADGAFPVALTGRVFCWADASTDEIHPGDLLTTSDTPGHAMKATDFERSSGAVIGKAMTGLDAGSGLVLVLIQPQ